MWSVAARGRGCSGGFISSKARRRRDPCSLTVPPPALATNISPKMPATAPFNPPSPDLPGKPYVRPWDAPPITRETHNFAQLTSIDLGKMDSDDPKVVAEVQEEIKVAIRDDGFIFLENYGVNQEQVRPLLILSSALSQRPRLTHPSPLDARSSTANSPSRSTSTITFLKKTKPGSSLTPTPVAGPATSTPLASSARSGRSTASSSSTGYVRTWHLKRTTPGTDLS